MQYSILGKTGLRVSRLAFGCSSLGDPRKQVSDEQSLLTVKAALEGGINLIDVSPYYGATRAEQIVGQAIQDTPRDELILATKTGRNGEHDFDFSSTGLRSSIEQSLKRLDTDYVDILQLHDIEYADRQLILEESLPTLHKLKAEGKTRFVGVTAYPLDTLRAVIENAQVDTVLSYCRYCLNDTALESLRPLTELVGTGLINASPLAMGLLSKQGPYPWHPASAEIRETCKTAVTYAQQHGEQIEKLAIQFVLQADWIPTTLVGGSTPDHVRQHLAWMQEPINELLLNDVHRLLQTNRNRSWYSGWPAKTNETSKGPADA